MGGSISFLPSCNSSKGETSINQMLNIPAIIDRNYTVGSDEEREQLLTTYDNALLAIKQNETNLNAYLTLAQVFITEARITGNNSYYHNAAMKMLENVLSKSPDDKDLRFQALTFKSSVLLSMHQFEEGLKTANEAFAISQHNAQLMGALIDANVELGKYPEAVKTCDQMINLRPDIRSYSRVSYLRQIYGDIPGAIEAMKMAVEAGGPGAESTEWARIILGDLFLASGDLQSAEANYKIALEYRKDYPYAYAALGRIEKAKKNYDEAIKQTENAIRIMSDISFVSQLADIYELKGDTEKAEEIREDIVDLLEKGEKEQNKEENIVKHNGARELATAYMKVGNLKKALPYAETDLNMRPENIDANELIAWIYYLQGDIANAKLHADKMMATNTKMPNTLYKAGLIYNKSGDMEKGNMLMEEAMKNPVAVEPLLIKYSK